MNSPKETESGDNFSSRKADPHAENSLQGAHLSSATDRSLEIVSKLGKYKEPKLGIVFFDPITGERIPNSKPNLNLLRLSSLFAEKQQDNDQSQEIIQALTQVVIHQGYPEICRIFGAYPTGFRLLVMSSRDPQEHESGKYPAQIQFRFLHNPQTENSPEQHKEFFEYLHKTLAKQVFLEYTRIHQKLIEPGTPREVALSLFFGGSVFQYEWHDPFAATTQVKVVFSNPFEGVPRSERINPWEAPQQIEMQVLSRFYTAIDALMRQTLLGRIIPEMMQHGIGAPNRVECELKLSLPSLGVEDPAPFLQFSFDTKPDKSEEELKAYNEEVVQGTFQTLLKEQFTQLCLRQIFPEIEKLPAAISGKFNALRFIFNAPLHD